jgi:hypothetical protein
LSNANVGNADVVAGNADEGVGADEGATAELATAGVGFGAGGAVGVSPPKRRSVAVATGAKETSMRPCITFASSAASY